MIAWVPSDKAARVLHVGCGNSELGKDVSDAGHDVVNVDYSGVVIEAMRRKHPQLCWVEADCAQAGALGPEGSGHHRRCLWVS